MSRGKSLDDLSREESPPDTHATHTSTKRLIERGGTPRSRFRPGVKETAPEVNIKLRFSRGGKWKWGKSLYLTYLKNPYT